MPPTASGGRSSSALMTSRLSFSPKKSSASIARRARKAPGHQNRVEVAGAAAVVLVPVALADVAGAFVQGDGRLVVREDVQLQLPNAALGRPALGRVEERAADPTPPVRGC